MLAKHGPDQLQHVFTWFDFTQRDFDWTVVNLAVDMLEHFVSRVEKAAEVQYSSDSTDMTDSQDLEEATLVSISGLAVFRTITNDPAATRSQSRREALLFRSSDAGTARCGTWTS